MFNRRPVLSLVKLNRQLCVDKMPSPDQSGQSVNLAEVSTSSHTGQDRSIPPSTSDEAYLTVDIMHCCHWCDSSFATSEIVSNFHFTTYPKVIVSDSTVTPGLLTCKYSLAVHAATSPERSLIFEPPSSLLTPASAKPIPRHINGYK